jgi:hypothetical protein
VIPKVDDIPPDVCDVMLASIAINSGYTSRVLAPEGATGG